MIVAVPKVSGFSVPGNTLCFSQSFHMSLQQHQLTRCSAVLHARRSLDFDADDDDDVEEGGLFEFARIRRQRRRGDRDYEDEMQVDESVSRAADEMEARGVFDRYEEFEDDDDEPLGGVFQDVLIPNPILDSIDPDGAADRFPELARDPKFWFDMVLFLAFINFVSFIGPRNPYPDFIDALKNAQLPPPGI
ncbi:MAG: hypothetical protein SGILL_002924 [Bacillariaceae sp.]